MLSRDVTIPLQARCVSGKLYSASLAAPRNGRVKLRFFPQGRRMPCMLAVFGMLRCAPGPPERRCRSSSFNRRDASSASATRKLLRATHAGREHERRADCLAEPARNRRWSKLTIQEQARCDDACREKRRGARASRCRVFESAPRSSRPGCSGERTRSLGPDIMGTPGTERTGGDRRSSAMNHRGGATS